MRIFDINESMSIIAGIKGEGFLYAIYQGTTDETLTAEFDRAMSIMALNARRGILTIDNAAAVLSLYNEKRYNIRLFRGYAVEQALRYCNVHYNRQQAIRDAQELAVGILNAIANRKGK